MNIYEQFRDHRPATAKAFAKKEFSFEEEMLERVREPGIPARASFSDWLNPPYSIRVFLVASVWAIPGYLLTMILGAFFHINDPAIAGTVGALLGALIGGCLEKE